MKVELEKLRLGMTLIGERIVVGIPDKDNVSMKVTHDLTNDFIKTVIEWGGGFKRVIKKSDGTKYEITCKKIK